MESSDNENHATKFVNDLEIIEEKAAAEGEVGGGGGGGGGGIEVEGKEQEKVEEEGEKGGEEGKKAGGEEEQEKAEEEEEEEEEERGEGEGENGTEYWRYIPLLNAALRGDWDSAKRFFDQDPDALTAHITDGKDTALHVAVCSGRSIEFVEKLVDLMPAEALVQTHSVGMIALHNAAVIGNTKAVAILVEKHPASLYIRSDKNWLPLHYAAYGGHKDTLLYLLSVTEDDPVSMPFAYHSGAQLLLSVVDSEFYDVRKPPTNFRQFYFPSKDLKKLLALPVIQRRAPLLLNFIPTYKSTLPDVPRRKKKSLSPPTATTQTASTSRADQGSTSGPAQVPADVPSTSAPFLVPIPERKHRRRLVKTAEMVRPKPVVQNLLADIPADDDAAPTQPMPPPKPKRVKKAQPKAKTADVEAEDEVPISILAESKKAASTSAKRPAETQPSESTQSKRPRSSSATTSGSRVPKVPWRPEITLEDKPVFANDSADDVNVGVALSTAVLLPGDLNRNAQMSEFENYALMLQHSVQAMQHAHSFSVQSFKNREELADLRREFADLQRTNKGLQSKMKKLEDQAAAAVEAQTAAEEKADAAEAIRKVAESEKKEAEVKTAQAEKELQEALATKDAEIKEADEKAYEQGMADVRDGYKLQVRQACNRGFSLGWMALAKKLDIPEDSPLRKADSLPLPFPPPPPADSGEDSEAEDEAEEGEDALVRKPKGTEGAKSPSLNEQVLDLTQDDEGDEVPKETVLEVPSSDALLFDRTITETISEIDAEVAAEAVAEKEAEVPAQMSTEVQP